MGKILLLFLLLTGIILQAQEKSDTKTYFSDALRIHLPDYNKKAKKAYRQREYELGRSLFDSLVKNKLDGTYMDNFSFRNLKKREKKLYDYNKPIFLLTCATWCVPAKGEIPALNDLAEKYGEEIAIIIVFWDTRKKARKASKDFSNYISVLYADETENNMNYTVSRLKHALGLPLYFFISKEHQIKDIQRKLFIPFTSSADKAYSLNLKYMEKYIASNLIVP